MERKTAKGITKLNELVSAVRHMELYDLLLWRTYPAWGRHSVRMRVTRSARTAGYHVKTFFYGDLMFVVRVA